MAKTLSAIKSIRRYCLDCCLENAKEVKLCGAVECWLYPYRLGKNPNIQSRHRELPDGLKQHILQRQNLTKNAI